MYVIDDKIRIDKPIVFLCGPYYDPKDKCDRRTILKKYLIDKGNFLPLIIDDFLIDDNIKDKNINIQLLEEIFSNISVKTLIFLDTFSTSAELGLFANNSFSNKITVFLPQKSDILGVDNIGFFVSDIILKQDPNRINYLSYRPKILRVPVASDYVKEFFGFINNEVPKNIKNELDKNLISKRENYYINIEFDDLNLRNNSSNINIEKISVNDNGRDITFYISIHMLFYLVVAIVYKNYYEKLDGDKKLSKGKNISNKKDNTKIKNNKNFTVNQVKNVERLVREYIFNTYCNHKGSYNKNTNVVIETKLERKLFEIIKHMMKFIYVYHAHAKYMSNNFISDPNNIIKDVSEENPVKMFNISKEDFGLINDIKNNPDRYYEKRIIITNKKKREIVKYRNNDFGMQIRKLHTKIANVLEKIYIFHESSYAYRKRKSIVDCINTHRINNYFLKYDIKSFFNSINKKILLAGVCHELKIDIKAYGKEIESIFSTCFYNNKLPLGLITSPILSDIYMKVFDVKLTNYLTEKYNTCVYTRYADDILISNGEMLEKEKEDEIDNYIINELKGISLKLNDKKIRKVKISETGDHFKFLGVNIVKGEEDNYLTVGRERINDVAKLYLKYRHIKDTYLNDKTNDKWIFYTQKRIVGQIAFINQVEGIIGYKKLENRILKCSKGNVILTNNIQ
ncbi:hypothetical protein FC778_07830 [Clostridium botulinum]|nr:hypothetical protein [Clostridium botulinum]